jgi:general secretion pathway protein E
MLGSSYLSMQGIAPLANAEGICRIALADPLNQPLCQEVAFILDQPVEVVCATTHEIRSLLAQLEVAPDADIDSLTEQDAEILRKAGVDGPIIRFVQDMLSNAVLTGASDIHVETNDHGLTTRFRLNGVLVTQPGAPALNPQAVIARLKVMAGLNVAERRLPQDGRLQTNVAGRRVDFRFSSLPTQSGESIVARVLDPKALRLGWQRLGFDPAVVEWIKNILSHPSGLFLVTGPTGSGKTTTLYTALSHLNIPGRKIVTVEDPVEYLLEGVQQVQVHDEIGLSFARILRGVLRHDPNVIMVGEIRDAETAEIAVRAAQVGRLVLSTLHTNSAQGAVNRLIDLGVPDFLLRDVLRGVLGQDLRLIRCPACNGAGCHACQGTGVLRRELRVETWSGGSP